MTMHLSTLLAGLVRMGVTLSGFGRAERREDPRETEPPKASGRWMNG